MIGAVAILMAAAGAASADFGPKEAVDARHNAYRETGAAFKTINDELKSGVLIKVLLVPAARTIAATARDQYSWFPVGSGPESGAKTKAKPEIWSDAANFREAQDRFQKEAGLMVSVVETGDQTHI